MKKFIVYFTNGDYRFYVMPEDTVQQIGRSTGFVKWVYMDNQYIINLANVNSIELAEKGAFL